MRAPTLVPDEDRYEGRVPDLCLVLMPKDAEEIGVCECEFDVELQAEFKFKLEHDEGKSKNKF